MVKLRRGNKSGGGGWKGRKIYFRIFRLSVVVIFPATDYRRLPYYTLFIKKKQKMPKLYDCDKCPGYCCGYPVIAASKKDIRRIATHFGMDYDTARDKFTEKENNRVRKMRQRHDKKLGTPVCVFLNQKTRGCSIYKARPQICRDHPGDRCEWNDRRLIESVGGRKVVRLKVMPWDTDGDYPLYVARRLPELVQSYAEGRGKLPFRVKS